MAIWGKLGSRGRVEDRRGMGPALGGGLGVTGVVLLLLFNFLGGGEITDVLPELGNALVQNQDNYAPGDFDGEDSYEVFASTVLGSNNDMWEKVFSQGNRTFEEPRLVLFRGSTQSACGSALSQIGPHYCPEDETIYLDETFFEEMQSRLGAQGGDVAEAYVIAHEAAHHAQHELGIMGQARNLQESDPEISNELSIKLELQADCFAGLWAYSIKELGVFEPGEIDEAIDAARSVGDDRIQEASTGRVNPESWTHGSSAQRIEWFNKGFEGGELSVCDTFNN
jgi:uncharacterized protein